MDERKEKKRRKANPWLTKELEVGESNRVHKCKEKNNIMCGIKDVLSKKKDKKVEAMKMVRKKLANYCLFLWEIKSVILRH